MSYDEEQADEIRRERRRERREGARVCETWAWLHDFCDDFPMLTLPAQFMVACQIADGYTGGSSIPLEKLKEYASEVVKMHQAWGYEK